MITLKKTIFSILLILLFLSASSFILIPSVKANPTYENYTTYAEVDPNNHIEKTAYHIDFDAYRDEDAYVYKDYGVGHFTDFQHLVDVEIMTVTNYGKGIVWCLSNLVDDIKGIRDASGDYLSVTLDQSGLNRIYITECDAGTQYNNIYTGINVSQPYYLTLNVSSTDFMCRIYFDSERTNLLDSLNLTLHNTYSFRYIFGCNTLNSGTSTVHIDLDIDNLDLGEGLPLPNITFNFTDGGEIAYYDWNTTTFNEPSNGSEIEFINQTLIKLMALPKNESYIFKSFNWTEGSSTSNPHNYTITANMTIWLHFSPTPEGEPPELPICSLIGHNTSLSGNSSLLYAILEDDNGLSGFFFSYNVSGAWQNETWASLGGATDSHVNTTITLPSDWDLTVAFNVYFNNTNGDRGASETSYVFGVDDPPTKGGLDIPVLFIGLLMIGLLVVGLLYLSEKKWK